MPFQAWGSSMPPGKGAAVSKFAKTSRNALKTRKNVSYVASRAFLCGMSCTDGLSLGEKKRPGENLASEVVLVAREGIEPPTLRI